MPIEDGWYVPHKGDIMDFEHYFMDGKSLCGKFVLSPKDAKSGLVSVSMGICQKCVKKLPKGVVHYSD